jgi:N-ethylmaleimide reductase
MFSQLWHTGRASHVDSTNGATPVSSSVNPEYWQDSTIKDSTPHGWLQPSPHRALETREIPSVVEDYRKAAERAKAAGFDGVELHAGNGYLPDQFLQDGINKRTDMYGGSIENRSRFLLQVVEAMVSVWGGNRVAVRIAPSGTWNGVSDSNPIALFDYVAKQLNHFGLAYLHIIEPRIKGNVLIVESQGHIASASCERFSRERLLRLGGLNRTLPRLLLERAMWIWSPSDGISSRIRTCQSVSGSGCR